MSASAAFRLEDRQVPQNPQELQDMLRSFGLQADATGNVCLREVAQKILDLSTVAMDAISTLNEVTHLAAPALMTATGKALRMRSGAITEHFGKMIGEETGETLLPVVEAADGMIRSEFVRVPAVTN